MNLIQRLSEKGDLLTWLAADGRIFYASDADQNDMVTGQTSFAATTPTFLLSVASGTTVIPLMMKLAQSGSVAGGAVVNNGFNALFGLSGSALGSAMTQIAGDTGANAAQAASQAFLPFVSMLMAEGTGGSATITAKYT